MHILHEVGVQILHHAADTVIIECHTGTAGTLHDVKNLLTHTKCVEEHCCSTKVHAIGTDEEAVRSDA